MTEAGNSRAKKDQVFLISQIGDEGTDIRTRANVIHDHIVKPIAAEFGLRTQRSDRDPTPGPVTSQILTSILESRVVVADLTGRNANVYYELAFTHSFGIPVVILVDNPDSLTFDVKNERVIAIRDDGDIGMRQGETTKAELKRSLEVVLDDSYKPRSLVTEVAGTQDLERLSSNDPMASELTNIRERVDQIFSLVGRNQRNESQRPNLNALLSLTRHLAVSGRLSTEELENNLITHQTSLDFDEWVRELMSEMPTPSEESDFEDIPF